MIVKLFPRDSKYFKLTIAKDEIRIKHPKEQSGHLIIDKLRRVAAQHLWVEKTVRGTCTVDSSTITMRYDNKAIAFTESL